MLNPLVANINLRCNSCAVATKSIARVHVGGATEGERFDQFETLLPHHGWGVVRDAGGNRQTICPGCLIKLSMPTVLDRFVETPLCPKCGFDKVPMRFCNGHVSTCGQQLLIDHLHRTCERCVYEWIHACK